MAGCSNRAAVADAELNQHRARLRFLREQLDDNDDTCPVCQVSVVQDIYGCILS
jgi:hypothetical protein